MAGFFDIVISHHKKNKLRARKYDVFKASMAAAALFAMADGKRDRREDATLRTLLKTLEDLAIYRKGEGTEMYGEFIEALSSGGEKGREKVLDAIAEVKGNSDEAALVAAIAATVIRADGVVHDDEAAELESVCAILGLDPKAVTALDVDARDQVYD